jgi:metacaspase-1
VYELRGRMSHQLSLLCVHGVSHAEIDPEFRPSWAEAITVAMRSYNPDLQPMIDFLEIR